MRFLRFCNWRDVSFQLTRAAMFRSLASRATSHNHSSFTGMSSWERGWRERTSRREGRSSRNVPINLLPLALQNAPFVKFALCFPSPSCLYPYHYELMCHHYSGSGSCPLSSNHLFLRIHFHIVDTITTCISDYRPPLMSRFVIAFYSFPKS